LRSLFLEGPIFRGAYIRREICITKLIWVTAGWKLMCYCTVFVLFYICGQFPSNLSPLGLIIYSRGNLMQGFCVMSLQVMFGRALKLVAAYFRQASQHVYMRC